MPKDKIFDDKTVLSTPNPVSSSSMTSKIGEEFNFDDSDINDLPQRLRSLGSVGSLDLMSFSSGHSLNTAAGLDYLHSAQYLEEQRRLAFNSIGRTSLLSSEVNQFIPSRLLRPTEISSLESFTRLNTESTINESDLLHPQNTSTPRGTDTFDMMQPRRQSAGQSLTSLSLSLMGDFKNKMDMGDVANKVSQFCSSFENMFIPEEDVQARLLEDELSWQQKQTIPVTLEEFSVNNEDVSDLKMSLGSFFKGRSDNLSQLLAKSPEKKPPPVALIDNTVQNIDSPELSHKSLSISAIAKVLSDSKESSTTALAHLLETPPVRKTSRAPENQKMVPMTAQNDSIEECKENFDSLNLQKGVSPDFCDNKSMSSRSSSSLSSLPNGKLPIETTKYQMIWGCVKVGRQESQQFVMRNKSAGRIKIKCTLSNPAFKVLNDRSSDGEFSSTIKLVLHPWESKTFTVIFSPTTIGAAADSLYFFSLDPHHQQSTKQFIKLYGYGGFGKIAITNIIKDTIGKHLLSLGDIDSTKEMSNTFMVKNMGTLPIFFLLHFTSQALCNFSSVTVYPSYFILQPEQDQKIVVTYSPQKEDFAFLQSKTGLSVMDVGKIAITYGTEANRGRLRNACQKAKANGLEITEQISQVIVKIPGELIPNDVKYLKEDHTGMNDIFRFFNHEEVVVTLERDLDRTVVPLQDETAIFHSLCGNETEIQNCTLQQEKCSVEPSRIILTPNKTEDMIFLTTNAAVKPLYFEVTCDSAGLDFTPKDGVVSTGETVVIKIMYNNKSEKTAFKITILVDNDSFNVDVKFFTGLKFKFS